MDDTPSHSPDIPLFTLAEAIYGLLEVILVKGGRFDVPSYQAVVAQFNAVKSYDRESLICYSSDFRTGSTWTPRSSYQYSGGPEEENSTLGVNSDI